MRGGGVRGYEGAGHICALYLDFLENSGLKSQSSTVDNGRKEYCFVAL